MRLSELLDNESVKSISSRTMISEENVEKILAEDYKDFTKAKTLGFLSILEREYGLNVKDVRSNAMSYFEMHKDKDESINIALPKVDEKKGRSGWIIVVILGLLGYASWYFFTQFDQKRLNELLPFSETNTVAEEMENNESIWSINSKSDEQTKPEKFENKDAEVITETISSAIRLQEKPQEVKRHANQNNIENTSSGTTQSMNVLKNKVIDSASSSVPKKQVETQNTSAETQVEENVVVLTKAVLKPVKRLWFGLIDIQTGKKDHFSIRKAYTIDLTKGEYLVATSPAPFALEIKGEIYRYNNGRSHYFKITRSGLTPLSKNAYVRQGGYTKW